MFSHNRRLIKSQIWRQHVCRFGEGNKERRKSWLVRAIDFSKKIKAVLGTVQAGTVCWTMAKEGFSDVRRKTCSDQSLPALMVMVLAPDSLGLDGPALWSHLLLVGSGSRREEPPGPHQQHQKWDKEKRWVGKFSGIKV